MSDDEYGWSSEDEEQFAASTNIAPDGKRKLADNDADTASSLKRNRHDNVTSDKPSASTVLANRILKERFGLNGFRLEQERAITRLLDGGSAVVVFPTGGGKSLCYQASHVFMQ
jgi:superfamily II DNA helicase RecQ